MINEYKKFLSEEECTRFIGYFQGRQTHQNERERVFEVENYGLKVLLEDHHIEEIRGKLDNMVDEYLSPYMVAGFINGFKYSHSNMYLYDNNAATPPHFDKNMVKHGDGLKARPFVFLVYLNDNFSGGNLIFNCQSTLVTPETGKAVMFPANYFFPHSSDATTAGKRYMLRIAYRGDLA